MEKISICEVLKCNRTLYKIVEQGNIFPATIGFKIFKIIKKFDEVEEYVMATMTNTFEDLTFDDMTDEQYTLYNALLYSEIELDFEKIESEVFEENEELKLSLSDISDLTPILKT